MNSPVWILRWVQQVDTAPLMDINASPTSCFAKEGYRHICGLKLAKKIVGEGLQKTATISSRMKLCLSMKKACDVSLCILWGRIDLFLFCGFNFLTLNRCVLAEQLVYEATKYVQVESYSVSLIHPTDLWRCKKPLP